MIHLYLLDSNFFEIECIFKSFPNSPMIPFLADTVGVVWDFLSRIILQDVLTNATNIYKLVQLDPQTKDSRKLSENTDIGFAAKLKLEQCGLNITDTKVRLFKKQAGDLLAILLAHLIEKSPLKHALVRCAASLNPLHMVNKRKRDACSSNFSTLLQKLVGSSRINAKDAGIVKTQFQKLLDVDDQNRCSFLNFNQNQDRLDVFFLSEWIR